MLYSGLGCPTDKPAAVALWREAQEEGVPQAPPTRHVHTVACKCTRLLPMPMSVCKHAGKCTSARVPRPRLAMALHGHACVCSGGGLPEKRGVGLGRDSSVTCHTSRRAREQPLV